VELQDFAPQHLYSQMAYAETQGFVLDERGGIASEMTKRLGEMKIMLDATAAELRSEDERNQYRIGIAQIYASLMGFDDFDVARVEARDFLELAVNLTSAPALSSMNVRTYDIAPADSFDALRDRLANRLATGADGAATAAGMALSDIGWVYEFAGRGSKALVHFGAMTDEQLKGMLRDEDGDEYPTSVLFLDIDLRLEPDDADKRMALDWWAECVDENRRIALRMGEWLKEMIG
jgi:hypothetical protein